MSQIKGCCITVAGTPWENLSEEHRIKIIERNTEAASEIVSRVVANMAEEGRTIEEIRRFLRLEEEVN